MILMEFLIQKLTWRSVIGYLTAISLWIAWAFTQRLTLVMAAMVMLIAADFCLRPKSR
jgi:hypothetical protein